MGLPDLKLKGASRPKSKHQCLQCDEIVLKRGELCLACASYQQDVESGAFDDSLYDEFDHEDGS